MLNYTHTERQLIAQVLSAKSDAESSCSQLVNQARENWDYYMAKLPAIPMEASSSVTDKTVWNHVEGAVSQVLPIFLSMENKAIEFTPLNVNDVDTASALTHYMSEKILFKNRGKEVLENAIREAFISRISWVKTHWGMEREAEQVTFQDLNTKQLRKLEKEYDEVIVTEDDKDGRTKKFSGVAIQYNEVYDLRLANVPLENILFPGFCRDVNDLSYISQVSEVYRAELVDMFGEDVVSEVGVGTDHNQDYSMTNFDNYMETINTDTVDPALEKYKLYEHYIKTSLLNKGGSLQWVQIFTVNGDMVEYNVVKGHPFSPITAVNIANSLVGYSFPELLKDIQTQRSAIMRASMSNALNMAYPRYQAVVDGYDVESLLNNVPGGVIEVKAVGNVQQFVENAIPSDVYNLYETLNIEAQRITGVSDMVQGLDPNVLKGTNAAATVITQMNAGTKRVLNYGKAIAEGWKDVMTRAYDTVRENSNKIDITYLGGKEFILFDKQFKERKLAITPVFGQDANLEKAQLLMSLADRYSANGALQKSYNPYMLEQMILDCLGVDERHAILTDPADIPPSDEEIYQAELQKRQADLQLQSLFSSVQLLQTQIQEINQRVAMDAQKVSLDFMKVQGDQEFNAENVQTDRLNVQIKAQEAGLKELEMTQFGEIEAIKMDLEMSKTQHQASMDLAKMMSIQTEMDMEQIQQRPVKFGE